MRIYGSSGYIDFTNNTFAWWTDGTLFYIAAHSGDVNVIDNTFDGNANGAHCATLRITTSSTSGTVNIIGNRFHNFYGNTFAFNSGKAAANIMYNAFIEQPYKLSSPGSGTVTYTNNYYAQSQTTTTSDYGTITSLEALEEAYEAYRNAN